MQYAICYLLRPRFHLIYSAAHLLWQSCTTFCSCLPRRAMWQAVPMPPPLHLAWTCATMATLFPRFSGANKFQGGAVRDMQRGPDHPESKNKSRWFLDFSARAGLNVSPHDISLRSELRSPNYLREDLGTPVPTCSAHRVPPGSRVPLVVTRPALGRDTHLADDGVVCVASAGRALSLSLFIRNFSFWGISLCEGFPFTMDFPYKVFSFLRDFRLQGIPLSTSPMSKCRGTSDALRCSLHLSCGCIYAHSVLSYNLSYNYTCIVYTSNIHVHVYSHIM